MKCRFCGEKLSIVFINLENAPLSNSYLSEKQLNAPEIFYPLEVFVCHRCFLVQVDEFEKPSEIFSDDYAYFSSFSKSWLEHAQNYVEMINDRLGLGQQSKVMEIASNDGYLLHQFVKKDIPCFGVEPTKCTADAAREKGVESIGEFFSADLARRLAEERGKQDLIICNNVLAHVPNINDFVKGLKIILAQSGTVTLEFPHVEKLINNNQFDTIYHEHFSYFSFTTVETIFSTHGLVLFDVEELPTHGGSLRIYAQHARSEPTPISDKVKALKRREREFGLVDIQKYSTFQGKAETTRDAFWLFLLDCGAKGKKVIAYGAAAKGNTFLNYCGIKGTQHLGFVVDASPHKQGKFLPGSHIPIVSESRIRKEKPDFVIIFPWNLREEISTQLSYIRTWGGSFVVAIPTIEVF